MNTPRRVVRVVCLNVIPQEQSGAVFHSPQSDREATDDTALFQQRPNKTMKILTLLVQHSLPEAD
jgi:hypothetical protein